MSISDEGKVSNTSKRSAKSPPRKIRHCNAQDESNNSQSNNFQAIPLTSDQVIEYARTQVDKVLHKKVDRRDIVVIPSLVSLSTDFFHHNDNVTRDVSVGVASAPFAAANTSSSSDFPSPFRTSNSNNDTFTPSLRPRTNHQLDISVDSNDATSAIGTFGGNSTLPQGSRSMTPPIGPQGAPIPQHIFNQQHGNNIASMGDGTSPGYESAERGTIGNNRNIINDEEFQVPSSPNLLETYTTDYQNLNIQLSAPARLGHSVRYPPQQQSKPESKHINAVESLAEALSRIERRIELEENTAAANLALTRNIGSIGDGEVPRTPSRAPLTPRQRPATPSTPKQTSLYKDNIDEMESSTITQLAEIILHPPIAKYVKCGDEEGEAVKYLWDKNQNQEAKHKDLLDSLMEQNDETKSQKHSLDLSNIEEGTSKTRYTNSQAVHTAVAMLGLSTPRRVCQHPFKRNDIVWVCRTCQSDETCVLCHDCFTHSNHEDHDVAFYHAQAGGCCDCGDADAWDPKGFCSKHGETRYKGAASGSAVAVVEPSVLGGVLAIADWLVEVVRNGVERGYERANPSLFSQSKIGCDKNYVTRSGSSSASCDKQDNIDTAQRIETTIQQSLLRRNSVADVEREMEVEGNENNELEPFSAQTSDALHEVQFNPSAASSSKKWLESTPKSSLEDISSSEVFDPETAGSRAAKKAKAPPQYSPARALGDLGRQEDGLFLILHADDIHTGTQQPNEVIEALKELYSNPGGGGRPDSTIATRSNGASPVAGTFSFGAPFLPRPLATGMRQLPRLAPRLSREAHMFSFGAPRMEAIINKIIQLVQKHGNIIVWGTQEVIAEVGDVTAQCWLYGDADSSTMIGAAMLNRAKILTDRGLICSIKTYWDLSNDQKATALVRLISSFAESCDPLCNQVSVGLSGKGSSSTLNAMIRSDLKLPSKVTTSWHALLLTLLAQPDFKSALAVAYCDTYRAVSQEYARGVGVMERSSFTLSVQFLNRVTYVENLVRYRNLLPKLSKSLLETMTSVSVIPGASGSPTPAGASPDALTLLSTLRTEPSDLAAVLMALFGWFSFEGDENLVFAEISDDLNSMMDNMIEHVPGGDSRHHGRSIAREATHVTADSLIKRTQVLVNPTLDPTAPFLQHRRYSPCISDLKCVLNVNGMSRIFLSLPGSTGNNTSSASNDGIAIDNWMKTLSLAQHMDAQMWRPINMGHIESEHRGWVAAFNTSISLGSVFERLLNWEDSDPCILGDQPSIRLLSCAEVTYYTLLRGVHRWQRSEMLSYRSTPHPSGTVNVPPHASCAAAMPFSTVASSHGTNLAMAALPFSQIQMWSFHLPLHRFAAACIQEVCRRPQDGGIADLLRMFEAPDDTNNQRALRQNALLFQGLMEFPVIILSRAAQIRAGLWRRNGPGLTDQVLNYSEPPFCKTLQDADILLVQFSLICQALDRSVSHHLCTSNFVNLLLHRFGVFDFLGFEAAPASDVSRYFQEVKAGLYPREVLVHPTIEQQQNALPWTYSPAQDFDTLNKLVEELLLLIIILITETPSPPVRSHDESAIEARKRLRREVVHRLVSGPKTHSEMAEVHRVLSHRDNLILSGEGKLINSDDASGAALESVLNDVAIRKTRIGDADQWELRKSAWEEYDPAFHRIGTRAHQSATEQRPKHSPDHCLPYAPEPPASHEMFKCIRKDLTSDAVILSVVYRVLHSYCYDKIPLESKEELRGKEMYEHDTKSETSLARAIHIITLGAFAWEDSSSVGGTDIGSVHHHSMSPMSVQDWVCMALLRSPDEVMKDKWYQGEENTLMLLKRLSSEGLVNDQALRSGALWICNFAAKHNSTAATLLGLDVRATYMDTTHSKDDDLEKRKATAKARQKQAIEKMKAQMAKFAETVSQNDEEISYDEMSNQQASKLLHRDLNDTFEQSTLSTPIRSRMNSVAHSSIQAMNLASPCEIIFTTPPPSTPRTPCSSGSTTPKSITQYATMKQRLLNKRPQCIICGTDDMQSDQNDTTGEDKTLVFCSYVQPSTVAKGGGGAPRDSIHRHVGVFVNLCGHAVHSSCSEAYLKTVHRDDRYIDRMEVSKRKEFRCPLCQRLSNCFIPFIDVGVDWIDMKSPETMEGTETNQMSMSYNGLCSTSLHNFLSASRWLQKSTVWDGHCAFTPVKDSSSTQSFPHLNPNPSEKKYVFGKKDLIGAWNRVLKTPRLVRRNARGPIQQRLSDSGLSSPNLTTDRHFQRASDVWRRFMDTVSDSALKADMKRLGEDNIVNDYGEFRHYLWEKAFYNKINRAAGKEPVDWPICISSATLSEGRRQELSKEKLLSKLLLSVQAFTYSCCSESAEVRRQFLNAKSKCELAELPGILSQFGIEKALYTGNLFLFPKALSTVDGGSQPFNGRLGKLRYFGLALMVSCSPLSSEIIQLCISFPPLQSPTTDPFDFDNHLKDSEKQRAPLVYPLLRSHILTHTVCCLVAATGRARADEGSWNVDILADDCKHFVTLGLIARITQYLLSADLAFKVNIRSVLQHINTQKSINNDGFEKDWFQTCLALLNAIADVIESAGANSQGAETSDTAQDIIQSIESAKMHAIEFLRDVSVIQQILIPNIFVGRTIEDPGGAHNTDTTLNALMSLFEIDNLSKIVSSQLTENLVKSWFREATEKSSTHLDTPGIFSAVTWPQTPIAHYHDEQDKNLTTLVPLLGHCDFSKEDSESLQHIIGLPMSYTDLYAELVLLCPDCEHIALCFVCGEVLNASGKGECTRHASSCGGGVGIFFLLQECVSLMIHGLKAAYIHSPYVDSHGETPQYRGRPLNLDASRYEILKRLWCGHKVREKVIAERGNTRQVILPNFY